MVDGDALLATIGKALSETDSGVAVFSPSYFGKKWPQDELGGFYALETTPWIKGIRDIFAGLIILPFLFREDRRSTATLFAISIFVPFCDGLVILRHLGFAPPIYIHWGTALYMMIVTVFLLRNKNPNL